MEPLCYALPLLLRPAVTFTWDDEPGQAAAILVLLADEVRRYRRRAHMFGTWAHCDMGEAGA